MFRKLYTILLHYRHFGHHIIDFCCIILQHYTTVSLYIIMHPYATLSHLLLHNFVRLMHLCGDNVEK